MDTRKILFEKFEEVLVIEHKMAQIYQNCLSLSKNKAITDVLKEIRGDEIRHGPMARRLLEIVQRKT